MKETLAKHSIHGAIEVLVCVYIALGEGANIVSCGIHLVGPLLYVQ